MTTFPIAQGDPADYAALARFHYLAGPPAVPVHYRVAHDPKTGDRVGVLVCAMPTLNGQWRDLAWPARYTGPDKRAAARRLNAEVRCIARVVVDPRYRGLGVARSLVRDYLHTPLTPATEAIAAMGAACRFFERAGMAAYPLRAHPADLRLADALAHRKLDASRCLERTAAQRAARDPLLRRELRTWGAARALAPAAADTSPRWLLREATHRLLVRPVAYAHTAAPRPDG